MTKSNRNAELATEAASQALRAQIAATDTHAHTKKAADAAKKFAADVVNVMDHVTATVGT